MEQRKRVVVTGMGVLTALGADLASFKQSLLTLQVAIRPSERFLEHFEHANAAEVLDDVPIDGVPDAMLPQLDKAARWAYKVGRDALMQADLLGRPIAEAGGLVVGVSSAGTEAFVPLIVNKLEDFSSAKARLSGSFSSVCNTVSSLLNLTGGFDLVATACTASTNAIGIAFDRIQNGKLPFAVIVGTEPLYLPTFAGFFGLKAMREEPCTPFSGAPGMSIGEGAAALVVEEYEHALARGAPILGEIISYATSGDAYHETAPDPRAEGAVRVMQKALANAGVSPEAIDYVNAHGTGTEANDRAETLAVKKVFGRVAVPISSTKSYVGHNIGAAGIIELVACLLTLPDSQLLPTLGFTEPRAGCDLDYVPNTFAHKPVDLFMKNNYAFGGNNCCIIAATSDRGDRRTSYTPRRVVVTGMGAIASAGIGRADIFDALRGGRDGSRVTGIGGQAEDGDPEHRAGFEAWLGRSPDLAGALAGVPTRGDGRIEMRVHDVDEALVRQHLRNAHDRKASKVGTFALLAVDLALNEAARKIRRDGEDIALIFGMSKGPHVTVSRFVQSLYPDPRRVRTLDFPGSLMNAVATFCSISKGIRGYNTTLATGFNAGLGALAYGYEIVRQGLQPQAIVGGAEENFISAPALLLGAAGNLNFSLAAEDFEVYGRQGGGYHVGEGACMAMLEDADHAQARGAAVLAEVLGYGTTCDAAMLSTDATRPARMLARAIGEALREAGVAAEQVDLVCGSSWGTSASSHKELDALRLALGTHAAAVPVVNYNGHVGFVESAAALMNLALALTGLERGELLPIAHTRRFCADGFDFVTAPRATAARHVLLLGCTEGGGNHAVVLRRPSA